MRKEVLCLLSLFGDPFFQAFARFSGSALCISLRIPWDFNEAAVLASLGMQVEEVDLYRKVGETNISHLQFNRESRYFAVLLRKKNATS